MRSKLIRFSRRLCLKCETTTVSCIGFEVLAQLGLSVWMLHRVSAAKVKTLRGLRGHADLHFSYFPVPKHTMVSRGVHTFNEDLVEGILLIHDSTPECFCHQRISIPSRYHVSRRCKAHNAGISLRNGLIGRIIIQQELAVCG